MEGQKLNLRVVMVRKAMALPMTLVILLFGSVLVATAFYVVQNMYSTSKQTVTEAQLYNAAESGMEKGKTVLWQNKDALNSTPLQFNTGDPVSSLYPDPPIDLPIVLNIDPGIKVTVDVLDCNYELSGVAFDELSEADRENLPPQIPFGLAPGGSGPESGGLVGYSNVIDPNRNIPMGGPPGGLPHAFVIRSTARVNEGTDEERRFPIEIMVVIFHE